MARIFQRFAGTRLFSRAMSRDAIMLVFLNCEKYDFWFRPRKGERWGFVFQGRHGGETAGEADSRKKPR